MANHLFVVSAPSGAGKTTLIEALVRADPALRFSISHTTRPKRPAERHGVHYYFTDRREFDALREAGEFLESACVFGHAYGTSRQAVADALAKRQDVILEIDWQGAAQVRERWPNSVSIFVLPPSREALLGRLRNRGQDAPDVIAARTAQAKADISHHHEFDHLVANVDFDDAVAALRRIIDGTRGGAPPPRADHAGLLKQLLSP